MIIRELSEEKAAVYCSKGQTTSSPELAEHLWEIANWGGEGNDRPGHCALQGGDKRLLIVLCSWPDYSMLIQLSTPPFLYLFIAFWALKFSISSLTVKFLIKYFLYNLLAWSIFFPQSQGIPCQLEKGLGSCWYPCVQRKENAPDFS